ncbi:hypothetical protein [Sphingomonas sp. NFR04]|uniref:hypothetical protein n=1 Tax=Sphingomonas sp. NFR04 TaxID=1566283 RepID=UPI001587F6C5|nr:hypothetical protein [Sphingomonas sp. NFR04]
MTAAASVKSTASVKWLLCAVPNTVNEKMKLSVVFVTAPQKMAVFCGFWSPLTPSGMTF